MFVVTACISDVKLGSEVVMCESRQLVDKSVLCLCVWPCYEASVCEGIDSRCWTKQESREDMPLITEHLAPAHV